MADVFARTTNFNMRKLFTMIMYNYNDTCILDADKSVWCGTCILLVLDVPCDVMHCNAENEYYI